MWTVAASDSGSARVRISYLLGNLTKSFNYRAGASTTKKRRSSCPNTCGLQIWRTKSFATRAFWARFGPHFHKPIGLNETKELLVEKYQAVPIEKTYTCNPAEFRRTSDCA